MKSDFLLHCQHMPVRICFLQVSDSFLVMDPLIMFLNAVSCLELVVLQDGWLIYLHFTVCRCLFSCGNPASPLDAETFRTAG